jgi:hypothetical protein
MSGPNARSAPKGWEAVVADLAEKHADGLEQASHPAATPLEAATRVMTPLGGSLQMRLARKLLDEWDSPA